MLSGTLAWMQEECNSERPQEFDSSKPSRKSKADRELLHRIYDRPEYTAIVRAIGSETLEIDLLIELGK